MSIDWLLRELDQQFNQKTSQRIIASYRENFLLWRELDLHELPANWFEFADADLDKWQPGNLALFFLDENLLLQDWSDLSLNVPEELIEKGDKTLETVRMTGLEAASLRDATLLALKLREYRQKENSWAGIADFLNEGKTKISTWSNPISLLPVMVPDFNGLLQELIVTDEVKNPDELAEGLILILKKLPLAENELFDRLVKLLEFADLRLKVAGVNALTSLVDESFLKLLASNLLLQDLDNDGSIEAYQNMATLYQFAGQGQKARESLDSAFKAINRKQAAILHKMSLELERSDPEEARKTWEEVLRLEPENDEYRNQYAEFLVSLNEIDSAIDLLDQIQDENTQALFGLRYPQLRAKSGEVHSALDTAIQRKSLPGKASRFEQKSDALKAAEYAYEQKNYKTAADYIRKALQEQPNDLPSIRLAARINQRLANLDDAIESSVLLSVFEPENKTNKKDLAKLYLQTKQEEKALEIYQEILKEAQIPTREDLLTYAEIAIKAGKAEEAIPLAENFLKNDPLDGEALVILCQALIVTGQKSRAVQLLEQAYEVAPEKPASWLSLAKIWTSLGENEQATMALKKAKAALPDDPQILTALGKLYLGNEQTTDAIATLRQAHSLDPANREIRKSLASALLKQAYNQEAWAYLEDLEDDYASDPELAYVIGQTQLAMDDAQRAHPYLQFAWNSLHNEDSLLSYATCLLALNKQSSEANQKELESLSEALENNQAKLAQDFEMLLLRTDLDATLGKHEKAYQTYLSLLDSPQAKSPGTYHHLQYQIGKSALALGMNDISLASLQEAMLVKPDDLDTRYALAQSYCSSELEEEANNIARAALQIAPGDVKNILWFSTFMNDRNNEKESIQVLKDALHLRPDEKILYLTLARTFARLAEIEETKKTLNRMLDIEGITTEEYVNIANLYLQLNQTEEASKIIQQAISGNPQPDFSETQNLVYSILRLGDGRTALRLCEDLANSLGNHPCYPVLLSDVLTANKQFLAALEQIKPLVQNLEFNPENDCFDGQAKFESMGSFPEYTKTGLLLRAIQLERMTGDLNAAQKHVDFAQKLDPDNPELVEIQAGLALALGNSQKLEGILDYIASQSQDQFSRIALVQLLCLDAMIAGDFAKVQMLWEHFLVNQDETAFHLAVRALLASQSGEREIAIADLQKAKEAIEFDLVYQSKHAFEIAHHFDWIWACLATAVAAWQLQEWQTANLCFAAALSIVRINPIVNQYFAAYLSDNARMHNNGLLLNIDRHLPELYTEENPKALLEEKIATAGKFMKPSQLISELKIGQAVFNGYWDKENSMNQLVKNGRQAAQVLSVLLDAEKISEIMEAFKDDEIVLTQNAILNLSKNPQISAEIAENLLNKKQNEPLLLAILAYASRGEPLKASEAMERALESWVDEAEWHAFAATMYQDAKQYPEAAAHLEAALRFEPKNARYWQLLGDVKLLEKDYHAAKDYFGKASDLFPGNPEALDSLARINQQLGEHQIAIQCWQKAVQLDPENPEYLLAIAQSYLAKKEIEPAMVEIDRALQGNPNHPKALLLKAEAEIEANNPELARLTIQAAEAVVADSIPFELLSIELDRQHNFNTALNRLKNLADANSNSIAVLNKFAEYQIEAGQLDKAEKILQQSLAISEENPQTLLSLGKIDRLKGNLDQAISRLDKAIKLDPSRIDAYLEMGQTFQDRREVTNAIETYHKAIAMVSKDPRPYVQASAAYKESRDYRNAEFMLRQAAQISPTDQSIRRQLAALVALNLVNNLQEAPNRK